MRVLGVDPSLTATAICLIADANDLTVEVSRTKPAGSTAAAKLHRMHLQVAFVSEYAVKSDLVLIEAPSFGSKGSATRDLAGLWWLMFSELLQHPAPVGVVTPSVLKKWVTGSGNADKFRVGQHISKRWPDVELRTDDQADALGLASMGLHHAQVLPWIPTAFQFEAIAKVEWNESPLLRQARYAIENERTA